MTRGDGKTTRAMQLAPPNAVYVWCNSKLHYPDCLARRLKRNDLKIVPPYWLEQGCWYGLELTGIVVDHACKLTSEQYDGLLAAQLRIRVDK